MANLSFNQVGLWNSDSAGLVQDKQGPATIAEQNGHLTALASEDKSATDTTKTIRETNHLKCCKMEFASPVGVLNKLHVRF